MTQMHVEPPPITLIKSNHGDNSDRDFFKQKFCGDPTSSSLDFYEFKMDLFENVDPEELLLFV